jgi:acid phosphatase type 7
MSPREPKEATRPVPEAPPARRARPTLLVPLRLGVVAALVAMWFVTFSSIAAPVVYAADPVIAAAGDIACDPLDSHYSNGNGSSSQCAQKATSNLLVNKGYAAVLALGDNQYYCGSLSAFQQSYDPTWGRVKSITHPVVGNHEYLTHGGSTPATGCDATNTGASGYFTYYGSAAGSPGAGYYSFNVGAWHLIALNSNCGNAGGCSTSSAQGKWLAADLAANSTKCLLAYWHIPLFSSGGRANNNTLSFWNQLYAAGADLVLDGHDHIYERFAPQTPAGVADPVNGITEITVGTGGSNHTSIASIATNSVVRNTTSFGVLKVTLHAASYDWSFVAANGTFSDGGTANCHHGSAAPSATATTAASASAGSSASAAPSASASAVASASAAPSASASAVASASAAPSASVAPSASPVASPSAAASASAAPTDTPAPSASASPAASVAASPSAAASATAGTPGTVILVPVADSYVDASNPTTNYGTSTQIRVDGSPVVRSYLRFNVSGLTGPATSAVLRVYANSAQATGYTAYSVADTTWGETTITDANAPAFGGSLGTSGAITAGTWTSVDVTSAIAGNGLVSFGLSTTNATALSMSSRTGANPPQLVVTGPGLASFLPPAGPGGLPLPLPLPILLLPLLPASLVFIERRFGQQPGRPQPARVQRPTA